MNRDESWTHHKLFLGLVELLLQCPEDMPWTEYLTYSKYAWDKVYGDGSLNDTFYKVYGHEPGQYSGGKRESI